MAMMQASAYLDSLKDEDEPEGEESREDAKALRGARRRASLRDPASPAARRMNELHTVKVRFRETIDLLPKFGELTGHFVDTNPAKRALQELIQVLEGEMDALAKGAKAEE